MYMDKAWLLQDWHWQVMMTLGSISNAVEQITDTSAVPDCLTQDTLRGCSTTKQGSQPKVTNLDNTLTAIDEDVVTFEIPVNDWRCVTMQIHQTT